MQEICHPRRKRLVIGRRSACAGHHVARLVQFKGLSTSYVVRAQFIGASSR